MPLPAVEVPVLTGDEGRDLYATLELAHHFGGATGSSPEEETVAESVAYVACAHFGLDTGERSFPYVATWSREPQVFRAALGRIQSLSSLLIDRVEAGTATAHVVKP